MSAQVQKKQKRSIKTYSQKPTEVTRDWYVVDASEAPLGRLATLVAKTLSGKNKVTYTPHTDGGDYVIVINSKLTKVTGNKLADKKYYSYSGYPGGLREQNLETILEKNSPKAIQSAVYGMLPKNKLRPAMMERLKVFEDAEHNHSAQTPKALKVVKKITKSKK